MKILCAGTQCGAYLGDVGPSLLGMQSGPVWYIAAGWDWVFPPGTRGRPLGRGILERVDAGALQVRRLAHEAFGLERLSDSRVSVARQAPLPIHVRCPNCHRLAFVTPDKVSRPVLLRA